MAFLDNTGLEHLWMQIIIKTMLFKQQLPKLKELMRNG